MAHRNEVEEVNTEEEEEEYFSINQWELAYSILLEKYKKVKHDNKCLKKKIKMYVHDSSPCYECILLKEELKKLHDKDASLAIETVELKSHVGQVSNENQKLKLDMSAYVKEIF